MVDIRPKGLPPAILPLRTGDAVIIDQGADGVRQTNPPRMAIDMREKRWIVILKYHSKRF
ncbi:hypothetical protein [Brucella phage EF4]|uniref:Uncharacterized protein n=1 Tax=Brucella phage EF4 TaxID=2706778 RepID=A0A6C0X1C9_9CAUD|nr:hypothetical protein [Brucella phage EF4]